MAATTRLLLLSALLGVGSTQHTFYGESISFMPVQKNEDGTFKVSFYSRENGGGSCETQLSYRCDNGACTSFENTQAVQTDKDNSGRDKWCQSEGHTTATISSNTASFSVSYSSCCWVSNINGTGNWSSHAVVDLGIRNDTRTFNKPPVTTTVASLQVPQNCFYSLPLLAYDPEGDHVRCRFTTSVGTNVTLDENECTVKSQGQLELGVHVFELVLEDYSTKDLTLSYADGTSAARNAFNRSSGSNSPPFSQVAVQFALEILPPLPNCVAGRVQPQFLSRTPSHGDVLHASVGAKFQLYVQAQAHHAKINDFQLSGPQNMTKEFKDDELGKAEVTVSWTPQLRDLHRFVPLCFTAETNDSQSEMRCVVVKVTKSPATEGKAVVTCLANQMTVVLKKASMPGIDGNWLKLKDPTCSLTSNDTHIMGTMSFSTCGTNVEDAGDFIVFKNEIHSFELANTIITRRRAVNIGFSCQFPKTITISNSYEFPKSDYIFTESNFGSFSYTFDIFTNSNFTTKASAYPVEVKLLDMVYMGIQAESELTDVTLFVEWCKATPEHNLESNLSYSMIQNGCLQDETVKVDSSNTTSFMFEVQAFKFTGNYDQVYITCSVILCENENPISRCAQGCLKNPSRKRRRSLYKETASHYITQGPLRVIRQAIPNASDEIMVKRNDEPTAVTSPEPKATGGYWGVRAFLSTSMSTVAFASLFIAAVVALAVASCYIARKRRAEDRNALLDTEWDN